MRAWARSVEEVAGVEVWTRALRVDGVDETTFFANGHDCIAWAPGELAPGMHVDVRGASA